MIEEKDANVVAEAPKKPRSPKYVIRTHNVGLND